MKTFFVLALALPMCVAGLLNRASASIQLGAAINISRGLNPGTGGGVFDVDDLSEPGTLNFQTFCAELTEHIWLGQTYYVYGIGTVNNPGGKTLGTMAAWYYTQFREGDIALSGANQQNAMQLGIWRGMGYTDSQVLSAVGGHSHWNTANYISSVLDPILTGWLTDTALAADLVAWLSHGPDYIGGVRVMNLASALNCVGGARSGATVQDQLTWTPLPQPVGAPGVVPEPNAIAIWIALLGLGVAASRRIA